MDKNSIIWILECCLLALEGYTKKQMLEFGSPEELADMGIKLCGYLKEKEIVEGVKNGF
jgi:hypothetical protein